MLVKIHQAYRYVVAICDSELLGKKYKEDKIVLDVKENFFNGDEVDEDKIIQIIRDMTTEDATFDIIGEKSINTALKCGLINKEGIKYVQGIPFALVLL
jgi:hypothetical protein